MSDTDTVAPDGIARVEQDGRVLAGGSDTEKLAETMERHAPEPAAADKPQKAADAAPDGKAPHEPVSRGRQRFADLTRERDEAKAEAAAAKAEREAIARERDELKAKPIAPAAEPAKPEPAKPAVEAKPKERFPTFEEAVERAVAAGQEPPTWYDYDDAKHEWRQQQRATETDAQMRARIREEMDADRQAQTFHQTVERSWAKGRESYADFDEMLKNGPGRGIKMGATDEDAQARVAYVLNHPQSEHLQYQIMKDGDLARKLASLSALDFGAEIGRLVSSQPTPQRRSSESKPPPVPYQPVNGSAATATTPASALAGKGFDFDKSGYREKRAAERKAARR